MNFIILIEFLLMTSQVSLGKIRNSSNDIYRLFTHLKYLLINPLKITNIDSPTSIFNELSVICEDHRSKTIDIFEILLTNYLLLFDTDEFHQIIVDEYSLANNQFLGSFFHLITIKINNNRRRFSIVYSIKFIRRNVFFNFFKMNSMIFHVEFFFSSFSIFFLQLNIFQF